MKYLLKVLIDPDPMGSKPFRMLFHEVEAECEEDAHLVGIREMKEKYPEAAIAVVAFATEDV